MTNTQTAPAAQSTETMNPKAAQGSTETLIDFESDAPLAGACPFNPDGLEGCESCQ